MNKLKKWFVKLRVNILKHTKQYSLSNQIDGCDGMNIGQFKWILTQIVCNILNIA